VCCPSTKTCAGFGAANSRSPAAALRLRQLTELAGPVADLRHMNPAPDRILTVATSGSVVVCRQSLGFVLSRGWPFVAVSGRRTSVLFGESLDAVKTESGAPIEGSLGNGAVYGELDSALRIRVREVRDAARAHGPRECDLLPHHARRCPRRGTVVGQVLLACVLCALVTDSRRVPNCPTGL
jgi:hypothetical protein